MNTPKVIELVVKHDLCSGCGLCTYRCPNNALEMKWDKFGFLRPSLIHNCDADGSCLHVCPFNPYPEDVVHTENQLADYFLHENTQHHPKIGKFINIYAGYSNKFRLSSSSGGIATYVLTELLDKNVIDHIFSVKESKKSGNHFEYAISSSTKQLLDTSKTRYFPVTLGHIMSHIHKIKGKVAIVGVACFIKAIRLAQYEEPTLKVKIPFLVGIICGGLKSSFFTEYIANKAGVQVNDIRNPEYRIKDLKSTSSDYSFGCININNQKQHTIKMRSLGDMWGTGLFKNNACDFCDDVTTELADISLGDAWIPPYSKDGRGTNVIITRSLVADNIIQNGVISNKLIIEELPLNIFLASQQGSYNHRHKGLSFRIKYSKIKKQLVPPKRYGKEKISYAFKIVQYIRMIVRQNSLKLWAKNPNSASFDKRIKKYLLALKFFTAVYHYNKRIR